MRRAERADVPQQAPRRRTPFYLAAASAIALTAGGLYYALKGPDYIPLSESAIYPRLAQETKDKYGNHFVFLQSDRPPLPSESKTFEEYMFTEFVRDPAITNDPVFKKQVDYHHGKLPLVLESVRHLNAVKTGVSVPDDFVGKNRELMIFFADFIDEPSIRDIDIVVPQSPADIDFQGTGTIYVVASHIGMVQTNRFYVQDFPELNLAPITHTDVHSGVVESHLETSSGNLELRQIYVTLDPEETIAGYNLSVSAECGHLALNKRSRALFRKAAEDKTLNPTEHDRIIREEEVFVHAAHLLATQYFLEAKGIMDAGQAANEMEERIDHFDGIRKYSGVDHMVGRLTIRVDLSRPLEERLFEQKQRIAAWKQLYLSGDRTMFDYLPK